MLSTREQEVLDELRRYKNWARPMDIGGSDGSDHGRVLTKLVRMRLIDKRPRGGSIAGIRKTWEYRFKVVGWGPNA